MPNPMNWLIRDNPGATDFFGNLGLGLAAMSQGGAPAGTNRFAQAAPFFQSAMQAPQQARQQAMMAELMQYKMQEAKRQQREAELAQMGGEQLQRTMSPWSNPDTGEVSPEGMATFKAGPAAGLPADVRGAMSALPPSQAPGALLKYMTGAQASDSTAPIRNFSKRQALVEAHGETSPQVRQFDSYVRAFQMANQGGSNDLINPTSPAAPVASFQKTLAPGEEPKVRYAQAFESTMGKASAELQGDAQKKALNAFRTLDNLDGIEPLIDRATGSMGGAALDALSAVFGNATEGAIASGKLKVLQAGLVLNMPRLEGPQSDKDTKLYMEAAGQIGDPTVPGEIKKGAIETIREIQNRYIKASPKGAAPPVDYKSKYGLD